MNKQLLPFLSMLCSFALLCCTQKTPFTKASNPLAERGVNECLAKQRKAAISELNYQLFFNIPEQKTTPISGKARITFQWKQAARDPQFKQFIVDFKTTKESILQVQLNEHAVPYDFVNEHLVFPDTLLLNGKNTLTIQFTASDQSLNRRNDFLYTLLVPDRARTLFPCFDQPDLKAKYSLSLEIPNQWKAVSNAPIEKTEAQENTNRTQLTFAESDLLSTYLFAFVCGDFKVSSSTRNGRTIHAYYRETDSSKLAQLPTIFDESFESIAWMEKYTHIPYPFIKYDLIILPGFQYGGMEHPGAILYSDKTLFLEPTSGMDEAFKRSTTIAHETAHQWFGDLVTMKWFNEVWTKEVFANYYAGLISAERFPKVDQSAGFVNYFVKAYEEDRTEGTNAVEQHLSNLNHAGLIYGNIIYNKAPVVMNMLVDKMGSPAFQRGIQEYLKTYSFSNATWDDLIQLLNKQTDSDLLSWSKRWIQEKGMPTTQCRIDSLKPQKIDIQQTDPLGRHLVWEQKVTVKRIHNYLLPNLDLKAYGYFSMDTSSSRFAMNTYIWTAPRREKASLLINLNENFLNQQLPSEDYVWFLLKFVKEESDQMLFTQAANYLDRALFLLHSNGKVLLDQEQLLLNIGQHKEPQACKAQLLRILERRVYSDPCTHWLLDQFENPNAKDALPWSESDLITLCYELAVRLPQRANELLATQRARISNEDQLKQFDFVSQALAPDSIQRDQFFNSLLNVKNRGVEPWVGQSLYYLNHPLREKESMKYIRPALDKLEEIQQTGDIFFPKNWVLGILRNHSGKETKDLVNQFLSDHPNYDPLLKGKILQALNP